MIFYRTKPQGGTEQMLAFCLRLGCPYKLIDIEQVISELAASTLRASIDDQTITVLNVAGPRLSQCPEVYVHVKQTLRAVLSTQVH